MSDDTPRIEDHVMIFHAGCGGIVVGPLTAMVCAECDLPMVALVNDGHRE